MGTRLDPTANERTAYIDSLCQILTYAKCPEEIKIRAAARAAQEVRLSVEEIVCEMCVKQAKV